MHGNQVLAVCNASSKAFGCCRLSNSVFPERFVPGFSGSTKTRERSVTSTKAGLRIVEAEMAHRQAGQTRAEDLDQRTQVGAFAQVHDARGYQIEVRHCYAVGQQAGGYGECAAIEGHPCAALEGCWSSVKRLRQ